MADNDKREGVPTPPPGGGPEPYPATGAMAGPATSAGAVGQGGTAPPSAGEPEPTTERPGDERPAPTEEPAAECIEEHIDEVGTLSGEHPGELGVDRRKLGCR